MKELSIEEKAKRYDEAIKKAKYYYDEGKTIEFANYIASDIFPELKESEDERVRKQLLKHLREVASGKSLELSTIDYERWATWVEKQGEQELAKKYGITGIGSKHAEGKLGEMIKKLKPVNEVLKQKSADKVEPKFEIGDLITNGILVGKIDEIHELGYHAYFGDYYADVPNIENWHKWTIQDAKPGDVLCTYECGEPKIVFILKGTPKKHYALSYHCYYNIMYPHFASDSEKGCLAPNDEDVKLATKEQRALLFQKMKEAGYEWDADKKELKKIEQKPIDVRTTGYWHVEDVEQKPARNEEELDSITAAINNLEYLKNNYVYHQMGLEPAITFLKSLKDRVQPQLKQEWSEEDEKMLKDTIRFCELCGNKVSANWLKSIKDRVQPQNSIITDEELAQAKKDAYNNVLDKIEYDSENPTFDDGWSAAIWYLKKRNAQPQNTWKPSDEQMEQLKKYCPDNTALTALYEQLKKLKG